MRNPLAQLLSFIFEILGPILRWLGVDIGIPDIVMPMYGVGVK